MAKAAKKKSAKGSEPARRVRPMIPLVLIGIVIVLLGAVIGYGYLERSAGLVYAEDATISAPLIALAPPVPGNLDRVFIAQGDSVRKGMIVAYADGAPIRSPANGRVVSVVDATGSAVGPTAPLAQLIDPEQMRVVAQVKENKGLSRIALGDSVTFTVDAFPGATFNGTVSEIAATSSRTSAVFSISNNRPTQTFDVKIAFDPYAHPELKNGMSAKVWIRT